MTEIVETVRVGQPADTLWKKIGGFGAVGPWHPMSERLLEFMPEQRFYRYGMETTPMPVRDYAAEFRIEGDSRDASTVRRTRSSSRAARASTRR